jgi:hypothetical protein
VASAAVATGPASKAAIMRILIFDFIPINKLFCELSKKEKKRNHSPAESAGAG